MSSHPRRLSRHRTDSPRRAGVQSLAPDKVQHPVTPRQVAEVVQLVLRSVVGEGKHAAKIIARAADASPETAMNWLSGRNAPGLAHALNLCRQIPELATEVRRLMAADAELNPDTVRDLIKLQQLAGRLLNR